VIYLPLRCARASARASKIGARRESSGHCITYIDEIHLLNLIASLKLCYEGG